MYRRRSERASEDYSLCRINHLAGRVTQPWRIRHAVLTEWVELVQARNVKVPTNHRDGYRLRVADCRVFFDFDGVVRMVSIEVVRKRDEGTPSAATASRPPSSFPTSSSIGCAAATLDKVAAAPGLEVEQLRW